MLFLLTLLMTLNFSGGLSLQYKNPEPYFFCLDNNIPTLCIGFSPGNSDYLESNSYRIQLKRLKPGIEDSEIKKIIWGITNKNEIFPYRDKSYRLGYGKRNVFVKKNVNFNWRITNNGVIKTPEQKCIVSTKCFRRFNNEKSWCTKSKTNTLTNKHEIGSYLVISKSCDSYSISFNKIHLDEYYKMINYITNINNMDNSSSTPTSYTNLTITPTITPTSYTNLTITPTITPTSYTNLTITPTITPTMFNIVKESTPTLAPTTDINSNIRITIITIFGTFFFILISISVYNKYIECRYSNKNKNIVNTDVDDNIVSVTVI